METNDSMPLKLGRVLFVDDEKNILKSLKRAFIHSDFEVFTAGGGEEGLKVLEQEKIDIVVSDYKMPELNGLQFLSIVRERFPTVYRTILSGFVEEEIVLRSIVSGLTLSYFVKPWEDKILEERILHILGVRKRLNNETLMNCINSIKNLPVLPDIYYKLMDCIEQDLPLKNIHNIIKNDVAIATKVLQIANSAFFQRREELSLERAIIYLGIHVIKNIVFTLSLTHFTKWDPQQLNMLKEFTLHSNLVNFYFAKVYQCRYKKRIKEHLATAGFIHDIGKVILLQYFPERLEAIIAVQKENIQMDFYQSECALGYQNSTHCELGAYFLDSWNFPEYDVEIALFHHTSHGASDRFREIIETLEFTDKMVNHASVSAENSEYQYPDFSLEGINSHEVRDIYDEIRRDIMESKNQEPAGNNT
jgi:HD-like signal output (HDOD) protein